jgi:hypothetical protein
VLDIECSFGPSGLANFLSAESTLRTVVASNEIGTTHADIAGADVALTGVSAALRSNRLQAGASSSMTEQVHELVKTYGVADSATLRKIATMARTHLTISDYTLFPGAGVSLQLYREFEGGRLAGYSLHYLRLAEDGQVLTDVFLSPHIDVH